MLSAYVVAYVIVNIVWTVQSASPSRQSRDSDGSASTVTASTVTADFDSSLQHSSSSSMRRRQVCEIVQTAVNS